jgi:hypothetical protein
MILGLSETTQECLGTIEDLPGNVTQDWRELAKFYGIFEGIAVLGACSVVKETA